MTIEEAYKVFKTQQDCIQYLEKLRWGNIPRCPHCNTKRQTPQPKEQRYRCGICRSSYSVTVRTVFHNTKIDLQKWFVAIPLVAQHRMSSRKLANTINVTKDTACHIITQVRTALKEEPELIKHFLN